MKRLIHLFTVLAVVLTISPVNAQQFYAGVLGGVNIADFKLTFSERESLHDVKPETFYGAGLIMGVRLMKNLSLQMEPMFQTHGGLYTEPSAPEMTMRVRMLDLPLFVKADFGKKIRPYLKAGPILNVKLDSEVESSISGLTFKGDLNDILRKTAFGLSSGAGVSVPIWKGMLFLEGRYSFSFSNFNKGGTIEMTANNILIEMDMHPDDKLKTINTQFILGYALSLGGK